MNHIDEFRTAIESAGLVAPETIYDDGQRHRFSSNGQRGDDSGWYILHGDDRPAGAFGCWRAQISLTWKSSARQRFTPEEKEAWKKRIAQIEREREQVRRMEIQAAAEHAAVSWSESTPVNEHPYLERKGISGVGCRSLAAYEMDYTDKQSGEIKRITLRNVLLVPMRHGPGALVGLQVIKQDGEKFFTRGTPAEGAYHVIGKPARDGRVVIVEGYATAASVHQATGWCVVIAFNAGNLLAVAKKIRAAMPDAEIVIGADDDAWTVYPANHPQAGQPWNPGIEAAEHAARAINATVAVPLWENNRPVKHTDFNDLHNDENLTSVKTCFNRNYSPDGDQVNADQPGGAAGVHPQNSGSSAGVSPFSASGSAAAPAASTGQAASVTQDEDIFIYASSPMDTAALFQQHLPDDGKVIYWRGEFYIWNGCRYAVRDSIFLQQQLYHFMARCMTVKRNPETGDSEVVSFSPKKSHIEDVMHALRAVCFADLAEPPTWLHAQAGDPDPGDLIAFRNGFLHVPTRTLLPSTPRLFVISSLEFNYNPAAPEPVEWLKFLRGIWQDDEQSVEALAEMFGYLLTDDTRQHKAFMMIGPPRSGKGTILRVLENLVGQHNRVSPSLVSLGAPFGLQPLVGKRLAMISDARLSGKADQQPIVENLLRITGEDSLSVPRKFLGDWNGKLAVRFVMASNETPSFSDASGALPGRFIMFKFHTSFLGREDHGLTNRLLAELPSIVLWALDGLDSLRQRGYLTAPAAGQELADEMREQSSPISSFVADKCVLREGASIERGELYAAWKQWCADQGMDHPGTIVSFGRRLSAAVAGVGRSQPREDGTRLNLYTGIRLRHVTDHDQPF